MKTGERKRFTENLIKDSIVGIVLSNNKILSVNIYHTIFSKFPLMNFPKDLSKYTKDSFSPCPDILEVINKNEYIPSITELKEIIKTLPKINFIWEKINLKPIPNMIWFWSSTLKNDNTVWMIRTNGDIYYGDYDIYGDFHGYVLCLLKNK
jgi:hypothetical protein